MKISSKGIEIVTSFEGLYLKSYKCPAGVWTIGYGHTGKVGQKAICSGMTITESTAISLLKEDMKESEKYVKKYVKVPLNQHQFDALVSFQFNTGALGQSTLLKKLNARKYSEAAEQFLVWNKAHVNGKLTVLNGLTRRRKAERKLFLTPVKKKLSVYTYKKFVKDIQKIQKLPVTGKATEKLLSSLPLISDEKNKNSSLIKPIKKYLKKLGYFLGTINSKYDNSLCTSVIKYKKIKEIKNSSGTIGKGTWKKLLKL